MKRDADKLSFAAFIMTFERPHSLLESLRSLEHQIFPPSYILIIDNSKGNETEMAVGALNRRNIGYLRVGYNSGPAGAARKGLLELSNMGYKWIYWGDDDNPPRHKNVFFNTFKKVEKLEKQGHKIGLFGGKGGNFNRWTGRIRSLSNKELLAANILEVDCIPGGQMMIVNSEVIKDGILPSEELFFGLEELDFCLKTRKKGYKIFIDSEDWLKTRKAAGNDGNRFRYKGSSFGREHLLWRNYYSTRNLLFILFKNKFFIAFLYCICKSFLKAVVGFKYGRSYGWKNLGIQFEAVSDFFNGNKGQKSINF